MKFEFVILTKLINVILIICLVSSCSDRLQKIKNQSKIIFLPTSIAENINTKYTDSGQLKSILLSPKMINFSNEEFPFYEFPNSINLTLLSKNNDSSKIISNRAVVYNDTDIIDLRGNVVLTTNTNDTLFTDQLYYDQKKEWLFTDSAVKFRTTDYITYGNGFDSNQNFTNAQVLEVTGSIFIEQ